MALDVQLDMTERLRAWMGTTLVGATVEASEAHHLEVQDRTLTLKSPESTLYLTLANGARIAITGPEGIRFNVYESPKWRTSKYAQGHREAASHLNQEEVSVHRAGRT